jgi:putative addiction module antidote
VKLEVKKIGNSTGLILPRELLDALKVAPGQSLEVTPLPDGGVRLSPHDPGFEQAMEVVGELMEEHRDTLKALAKKQDSTVGNIEFKKIGNSAGFIVPKEIVTRLRIELGDRFVLTETANGGIMLNRADPTFEKGLEIARKAMKTYRNALGELAK